MLTCSSSTFSIGYLELSNDQRASLKPKTLMGTKLEPLRRRKKKPSFCKVMVGDFSTRLRIPEAFVKYFDGGVPYKSILWGPSGISWRVNVKEVDNNLFFHKGWGAFVQDNSLKMADFLLFRYAGDSNFCVKIYGKDCCEKGVSGDSTKSCTPVCGNENEEEVKIMRNHLKRTREKLVGSGANEVGTKRSVVIHIDSDASDDDIGKSLEVFPRHLSLKSLKIQKSARALEAANKFISNYPSFQVLMYHAYVHAGNLFVPTSFVREYMERMEQNITLQTSDRSWTMKLVRCSNSSGGLYGRLTHGWHAFAIGNALVIGDVCVFELINRTNGLFKVSIFRCSG